jgi:O-antigen ligase
VVAIWCETGLHIAAFLFFPLLVLVPRGIAALTSVAGLCALGLVLSTARKRYSPVLGVAAALLCLVLLWGAISALWSVTPLRSLAVAGRLTGLFAAGLALATAAGSIAAPRRLTFLFLLGLVVALAIACAELATGGLLGSIFTDRPYRATRLNQASISFAILLLPASALLAAMGQRLLAAVLTACGVATVFALVGTAAKFLLVTGFATGLLIYLRRGFVSRAAALISIVAIVAAPLTFARLERVPGLGEAADGVKISAGHRLLIWSFAGDRIAEHPLIGWGLDASRAIPGGEELIRTEESWLPLHPHNAALQLWLELGVPGAVLFALLVALAWCALAAAAWPHLFAAAAGAGLTIALAGSLTTYGIWQEWWLGALWFSLFLVLVMAQVAPVSSAAPRG